MAWQTQSSVSLTQMGGSKRLASPADHMRAAPLGLVTKAGRTGDRVAAMMLVLAVCQLLCFALLCSYACPCTISL